MDFGTTLRERRERAGLSQNALARLAELNPATINRLESGERAPSNRELVERIAAALRLSAEDRDALLGSAGHNPDVYERVPPADPTLVAVARVLADPALAEADRQEFRTVIGALARRWRAATDGGSDGGGPEGGPYGGRADGAGDAGAEERRDGGAEGEA